MLGNPFLFYRYRQFFIEFFTLRVFWRSRRDNLARLDMYLVPTFLAFFALFRYLVICQQVVSLLTRLNTGRLGFASNFAENFAIYDSRLPVFPSEILSKDAAGVGLRRRSGLVINVSFRRSDFFSLRALARSENIIASVGFSRAYNEFPLFSIGDTRSEIRLVLWLVSFFRFFSGSKYRNFFEAFYLPCSLQINFLRRGLLYSGNRVRQPFFLTQRRYIFFIKRRKKRLLAIWANRFQYFIHWKRWLARRHYLRTRRTLFHSRPYLRYVVPERRLFSRYPRLGVVRRRRSRES